MLLPYFGPGGVIRIRCIECVTGVRRADPNVMVVLVGDVCDDRTFSFAAKLTSDDGADAPHLITSRMIAVMQMSRTAATNADGQFFTGVLSLTGGFHSVISLLSPS
jgi:hypothetical protein